MTERGTDPQDKCGYLLCLLAFPAWPEAGEHVWLERKNGAGYYPLNDTQLGGL